ncbi:hypothetical protein CALVIDRAFT_404934 [Calocera viscosa TUFC12733]|uniref:Uncharacterized protein n=1 Tax=Calocera viscosa (strain TUFC12733) TaxID=1330018 RepID=A0A167PWN5_CALVF|nr:hypothetical protein CALVIDRAFT_404934 [Calocera viscosa TUFC12733]
MEPSMRKVSGNVRVIHRCQHTNRTSMIKKSRLNSCGRLTTSSMRVITASVVDTALALVALMLLGNVISSALGKGVVAVRFPAVLLRSGAWCCCSCEGRAARTMCGSTAWPGRPGRTVHVGCIGQDGDFIGTNC